MIARLAVVTDRVVPDRRQRRPRATAASADYVSGSFLTSTTGSFLASVEGDPHWQHVAQPRRPTRPHQGRRVRTQRCSCPADQRDRSRPHGATRQARRPLAAQAARGRCHPSCHRAAVGRLVTRPPRLLCAYPAAITGESVPRSPLLVSKSGVTQERMCSRRVQIRLRGIGAEVLHILHISTATGPLIATFLPHRRSQLTDSVAAGQ
jgi:hypothetical protein